MVEMIHNITTTKNDNSDIDSIAADFDKMKTDAKLKTNVAPPQDSKNHILNALNDDCIKEIFDRVQNIDEFLSAAKVCVRFQENAKECYPERFKGITIGVLLTLEHVPSFLSIFGRFLHSIVLIDVKTDRDTFNVIADFCGETLKSLRIMQCKIVDLRTRSPFRSLEYFEVYFGKFRSFNVMPPLKSLKFYYVDIHELDWLAREFPELEIAKIPYVHKTDYDRDIIEIITKFIEFNPQLRHLELETDKCPQKILECIGKLKLEHLALYLDESHEEMDFSALRRLLQLKTLHIHCPGMSVQTLIDSFAENNVPLENVSIVAIPEFIESLVKFKSLKTLGLLCYSDEDLIHAIQSLPFLPTLNVYSTEVTIDGIKRALRYGPNLRKVGFHSENISYSDECYSVLALAHDRNLMLKISFPFELEESKLSVPCSVEKYNERWYYTIA